MAINTWLIGASVITRSKRCSSWRDDVLGIPLRRGGNSELLTDGGSTAPAAFSWGTVAACFSSSLIRFWADLSCGGYTEPHPPNSANMQGIKTRFIYLLHSPLFFGT